MDTDTPSTNSRAAADALATITRVEQAALRRGLPSRAFSLTLAAWAGIFAALIGFRNPLWTLWLFAGVAAYAAFRQRVGAWILEVRSRGALLWIVPLGLLFGAIFIAGAVAFEDFDRPTAPWISGATIAVGLYSLMELAYARTRDRLERDRT